MAAPLRLDSPRAARLVRAIQDLAEDTLESSAQTHLRIDMLALRLQNLANLVTALERRIAQLELKAFPTPLTRKALAFCTS